MLLVSQYDASNLHMRSETTLQLASVLTQTENEDCLYTWLTLAGRHINSVISDLDSLNRRIASSRFITSSLFICKNKLQKSELE